MTLDSRAVIDGARLRALRQSKRLTQGQLAGLAGLTEATVGRMERGEHGAQPATIRAVAAALDVDMARVAPAPTGSVVNLPPLAPRLTALLDEYDAAPRGSDDHLLAALVRATVSAYGAIGRARERDEARAVLAEQRAVAS